MTHRFGSALLGLHLLLLWTAVGKDEYHQQEETYIGVEWGDWIGKRMSQLESRCTGCLYLLFF